MCDVQMCVVWGVCECWCVEKVFRCCISMCRRLVEWHCTVLKQQQPLCTPVCVWCNAVCVCVCVAGKFKLADINREVMN